MRPKNTKVDNELPKAVIAGAFQTGVCALRNLRRNRVDAFCFDSNPKLQGFHSVYGPARLCPDPDSDISGWLSFMSGFGEELGEKAVLIPSSDKFVTAIANNRVFLSDYFQLSPGIETQGLLAEKHTQYDLAMKNGMPMPATAMVAGMEDLEEFSSHCVFPCLIKPWHFRHWEKLEAGHPLKNRKISIARSKDQLINVYESVRHVSPNVIAQEIIEGPDTNKRVYLSCYSRDGQRIANAMFKELRCVPIGFGPASVSVPVVDEETDDICNNFLRKIGYSGICEIEAKRDARDGKVKLIEANPRLSGGGDAAPYAGVDLVWIHYQEMIGRDISPIQPTRTNFKHIVLREDAIAIPVYMRAGLLSWRDLIRSYTPPLAFFDVDWRDWRIAIESIVVFFLALCKNVIKPRNVGAEETHIDTLQKPDINK